VALLAELGVELGGAGSLHANPLLKTFVAHYRRLDPYNVQPLVLPAFMGRGLTMRLMRAGLVIGATKPLRDQRTGRWPIIEQDVARHSHRDQVEDLVARGRDLERVVLSRAVRWHLERRILLLRQQDGRLRLGAARVGRDESKVSGSHLITCCNNYCVKGCCYANRN